jgi:hypothetical protein
MYITLDSRFDAGQLVQLVNVLRILPVFVTRNRYFSTAFEALCLLCARLRSTGNQYELAA